MGSDGAAVIEAARFDAVVFDMDGVVTQTATVHAAAWKAPVRRLPRGARPSARGEPFRPFDLEADYLPYVDGKARYDGVRDFLASRGIELPLGRPLRPARRRDGLRPGQPQERLLLRVGAEHGVKPFPTTVELIAPAARGRHRDGHHLGQQEHDRHPGGGRRDRPVRGAGRRRRGRAARPARQARPGGVRRGGAPARRGAPRAVVVEDAEAGVEAGHRGGFGLVIGVDRSDHAAALRRARRRRRGRGPRPR